MTRCAAAATKTTLALAHYHPMSIDIISPNSIVKPAVTTRNRIPLGRAQSRRRQGSLSFETQYERKHGPGV